jgi:hypothetical protein
MDPQGNKSVTIHHFSGVEGTMIQNARKQDVFADAFLTKHLAPGLDSCVF